MLWLEGKLTNFEYLTHLNKIAGRSFNDMMQYPVFPFILCQYDRDTIDLETKKTYRLVEINHEMQLWRLQYCIISFILIRAGCPRRPINPIIETFVLYLSYILVNVDFVLYFLEKRPINPII